VILCHNHPSGDPTPQTKDRRQFHRWLIGIDEDGIFINPALLARAEAVVATPRRSTWVPGSDGCHQAPITDRQELPLGADHFVRLRAPAHALNEIVEHPALPLRFPHDELRRVRFHQIELQPLATRCELNGQA
jgi:hypothetical protein